MTAGLLDLAGLSARSGVSTPRPGHYAATGLLPPARRDGDRFGCPPAEVRIVRMLAGAEDLGFDTETLTTPAATSAGTAGTLAAVGFPDLAADGADA